MDTYIDIECPVPDAKVASVLCGPGGPIKYKIVKSYSWLTESFLVNEIAPSIKKLTNQNIALTLSKCLIYASTQNVCSMDESFQLLPTNLRNRIMSCILIGGGFTNESDVPQLVQKVPILVRDIGGQLDFSELGTSIPNNAINDTSNESIILTEINALNSTVLGIKKNRRN